MTLWNNAKEMWGQFEFLLLSPTLVWSTPLGHPRQYGGCMHQHSTCGMRKRRRRIRIRRWYSTCWHMAQYEGWVDFFGGLHWWRILWYKGEKCEIKSGIWTTNIRFLGFWNIRECVTLWRLTLRSLGCCVVTPLTCSVKSYVIGPSTKCYFNEFLFMWVLKHNKIEQNNGCEHSECHGLPVYVTPTFKRWFSKIIQVTMKHDPFDVMYESM